MRFESCSEDTPYGRWSRWPKRDQFEDTKVFRNPIGMAEKMLGRRTFATFIIPREDLAAKMFLTPQIEGDLYTTDLAIQVLVLEIEIGGHRLGLLALERRRRQIREANQRGAARRPGAAHPVVRRREAKLSSSPRAKDPWPSDGGHDKYPLTRQEGWGQGGSSSTTRGGWGNKWA